MSGSSFYAHSFRLPIDRQAAFELFADPRHLDFLTPAWFRLRFCAAPPRQLEAGLEISYRLHWHRIPFHWTSRLTDWRAPDFFAYEQRRGPYSFFRHEHFFHSVDGGTEIRDHVFFRAPGGRIVDRLIVRPDLRRIFEYRERRARAASAVFQPARASSRGASFMPLTSASSSAIERPT